MAVVDLTRLRFADCSPIPLLFGTVIKPPQGGAYEAVDRLGDRWAMHFVTRPMAMEPDGRSIAADLTQALKLGGMARVAPPNLPAVDYGSPTVASDTAAGKSVPITGGTPGRPFRKGQWVSLVVDGQRYLDRLTADGWLNGSGAGTLSIANLLRVPLTMGDAVELTAPRIEGTIEGGFAERWIKTRLVYYEFTIEEAA